MKCGEFVKMIFAKERFFTKNVKNCQNFLVKASSGFHTSFAIDREQLSNQKSGDA